ncbi:MBL fold metallo-hydrolase [Mucilaginibacter aquatilis]|uniref:MBL fold metallo-hydrolase n=1 Tax=Mucilaginibacter aquatilis TaxID=1517760 RepID=A0A6I4I4I4_9SPHI|nr:MBL fold metallo-hydrolase [Mucilaginibacter aquatilis]MVN89980.1 MBL fold metallo-hydrolase [Mucilaginibacter aquatilis]
MALYITSLNSGSNGNCYYVGNKQEAVLIDVGISCREVERRMLRLGLNIQKVKAIFISHEHSDHIRGLTVLSKKYQIPVYITAATMHYGRLFLESHLVIPFKAYEPVLIGGLKVNAFPKYHDAAEPHSFLVSCCNVNVGVFTDIGATCQHLIKHFNQCHAAFLEANYDEAMLASGSYPYHLKKRISGGRGHLSNHQALELFKQHRPQFMSHLLLAHLSKDNNCPDVARNMFLPHAQDTQIIVTSRYQETPVYQIKQEAVITVSTYISQPPAMQAQYSLF